MATERQVISISLSQQQSEFIKNRPEGQSAYIQKLIDMQMDKSAIDNLGMPRLPENLGTFILNHLDNAVKEGEQGDELFSMTMIGEEIPNYTLKIQQISNNGVSSWVVVDMIEFGIPGTGHNAFKVTIRMFSELRPNDSYCDLTTRSDPRNYYVPSDSKLATAFLDTAAKFYPESYRETKVNLDKLPDTVRASRFKINFFSPIKNSPWNIPELPYYVNKVDFGYKNLYITFVDNENFALHREKVFGLVTVDITTLKWSDGTDIETTRYNCCVSTSNPPRRSPIDYRNGKDACRTTVQFTILQQDDVKKLDKWSLNLAEHVLADKQFLCYPNVLPLPGVDKTDTKESSYQFNHHAFTENDRHCILDTIDRADTEKSYVLHYPDSLEPYRATFYISDQEYLHISIAQCQPGPVVKTSWTTTLSENDVIKHQTWWRGDDIKWLTDILDPLAKKYNEKTLVKIFFLQLDKIYGAGPLPSIDRELEIEFLVESYVNAAKAIWGDAAIGCTETNNGKKIFTMRTAAGAVAFTRNGESVPTSVQVTMETHDSGKVAVTVNSYGTKPVYSTVIMDKGVAYRIVKLFMDKK